MHNIATTDRLMAMLSVRRPHGSKSEKRWIKEFIDPFGCRIDAAGNRILRIGDAPVLWSAHTDTVHRKGGTQKVYHKHGLIHLSKTSTANCLGADDGAGVFLLTSMIAARVPGLYVFHRAEEIGGHGSEYIANKTPELLDGIKVAIALDRKGTKDIITDSMYGNDCSDAFADSLSSELGMGHKADPTGMFTDTANYRDLIPECTNVSVGYEGNHGKQETLDTEYLFALLDALLNVDLEALVVERDPLDCDGYGYDGYGPMDGIQWDDRQDFRSLIKAKPEGDEFDSLVMLTKNHPDVVADLLSECGIRAEELHDRIMDTTGIVKLY